MNSIYRYIVLIFFYLYSAILFSQEKWSLEDCIEYAKQNNIDVLKQKIRTEISNKDIKIEKGNYLPNANFNASQNFSLGNSFNVSTSVGQRESSSNSFSLSSSLNLFNGFKNKHSLERAKLAKQKNEAEIDKIRFDLVLNLTNKYLQILFNKELLRIAKDQIKISEQNQKRLKELYNEALIGEKELLEIESTLATDIKEKIIAENKVKINLIELQNLLGIEQIKNFDVEFMPIGEFLKVPFDITKDVIENNPEINISRLGIKLKSMDNQLSKVNYYPRLSLNYSYSSNYFHLLGQEDRVFNQKTGQNEPNGFWVQLNNNRTHYIGISATIPLFNKFLTKENHKKSLDEVKIAEMEHESRKKILINKIKTAELNVISAKATLDATKTALETQEKAFEISKKQYRNGSISNYEFLEGKQRFIKKSSDYLNSKYEYFFKLKILDYYRTQ